MADTPDPIQGARQALAPDPDAVYGDLLPLATNRLGSPSWVQHGPQTRLALPASVRQAARGWIDALGAAGGANGVTPEAARALLGSLLLGGLTAPARGLGAAGGRMGRPGMREGPPRPNEPAGGGPPAPTETRFPVADFAADKSGNFTWREAAKGTPEWRFVRDPLYSRGSGETYWALYGPDREDQIIRMIVGKVETPAGERFVPGWYEDATKTATLSNQPFRTEHEAARGAEAIVRAARPGYLRAPALTPGPTPPSGPESGPVRSGDRERLRELMRRGL